VIHCSLVETPHVHVVVDSEEAPSIHGWPATLGGPARPQTEDADGATYEEHRFGTARGFAAAAIASAELGPLLASWTAYAEDLAEVADTDPDARVTSFTTFRGLSGGTSITAWGSDQPGHDLPGHYAQRVPESLRLDGAAAVPVRIRAHVRFGSAGSGTGTLRFQSTARSWIGLTADRATIGTTWTWIEITGWLECSHAVDDSAAILIDLWKTSDVAAPFECRYWSVHYSG
jgi:hypothetical protein